jgi:hypothetical protein
MNESSGMLASSFQPDVSSALQHELADILDEYLRSIEGGLPADADVLIARHPHLAGPLREYLDGLAIVQNGAAEFKPAQPAGSSRAPGAEPPAAQLGDFELLREIGRGGMGIVYEARQLSLDRKVAVKVLPFGAVLDEQQIRRFQNEARAAAQSQHPNIVPIYAVGSERGVHYYAMQFIEGYSLTQVLGQLRRASGIVEGDAVDTSQPARAEPMGDPQSNVGPYVKTAILRRTMGLRARRIHTILPKPTGSEAHRTGFRTMPHTLQTFPPERSFRHIDHVRAVARLGTDAAEALHTAHECGVIHRDVKPSNLLLDHEGKLWVTDFGLARCRANASFSKSGDVVGTLRYMSPEQAQGQTALVDQRTDIYSLGVTLYELLTLRRAFDAASGIALTARIEAGQWKRLRTLNGAIPADLENVITKAIAVSREDRYSTAKEFADDLRRFLQGLPTRARPPSWMERLSKWARRHRRGVLTAGLVLCTLCAGLAASTLLVANQKAKTEVALQTALQNGQLARQHLQAAEANLEQAQSAVDHFGARAAELLADIPGTEYARHELLSEVLQYYERILKRAGDSPRLQADTALTHANMAKISQKIGDKANALAHYGNAERILQRLVAEEPDVPDHQLRLARCLNNIGLARHELGQTDNARTVFHRAIEIQERLTGIQESPSEVYTDLALSWNNLGLLRGETGECSEAAECYHEAVRVLETAPRQIQAQPQSRQTLASIYNNLGMLGEAHDPAQAKSWAEKALSIYQELVARFPQNLAYKADLAMTHNNLGALYYGSGKNAEALAAYQHAAGVQQQLIDTAPFVTDYRCDLALTLNNCGLVESKLGELGAASQSFRQAIDLQEALVRDFPADVRYASRLGGIHNNLAMVYERQKNLDRAAESYTRAIRYLRYAHQNAPQVAQYREYISRTYFNYGRLLRRLGRPMEAAEVALRRRALWPADGDQLYSVAQELALSCRQLPGGNQENGRDRARYADEGVRTLQDAVRAGWKPTGAFQQDVVYETFRSHPELSTLLAGLTK